MELSKYQVNKLQLFLCREDTSFNWNVKLNSEIFLWETSDKNCMSKKNKFECVSVQIVIYVPVCIGIEY